jgi:hypothetical protein
LKEFFDTSPKRGLNINVAKTQQKLQAGDGHPMQTISIPNFSFSIGNAPNAPVLPVANKQPSVAEQAQQALVENPHLKQRRMRTRSSNGKVTIAGSVQSYFEKQMAQEALRNIDGVTSIENQLVVNW